MVRRIAVLGVFLFAVLGVPRTGHAAWFEFIWEMSGPRMIGAGLSCSYSLKLQRQECEWVKQNPGHETTGSRGPFIVLRGAYMFSTDHDSKTQNYDWFDAQMVAVEPELTFRSKVGTPGGFRISHGAGISYDVLFGSDFSTFDKFGFTITPVELSYKCVSIAARIRVYPNGFTDDEFGFGPRVNFNRPAEATYGFGLGINFR